MTTSAVIAPKQVASSAVVAVTPLLASSAAKGAIGQASARLVIGEPCEVTSASTSAMIIICKTEESWLQKGLLTAPSLFTSLAALLLSWSALKYNRTKDQRARTQSINDDFWLRKVVSPVAIEPFVKFTIALSASLPSASSTSEEAEKFWISIASSFNEFSASFHNLALISLDLHKEVADLLENMEDILSDYCGKLQQHLNDRAKPIPDRTEVLSNLGKTSRAAMQAIAKFQANVGDN